MVLEDWLLGQEVGIIEKKKQEFKSRPLSSGSATPVTLLTPVHSGT
jgi:hypothetical protein